MKELDIDSSQAVVLREEQPLPVSTGLFGVTEPGAVVQRATQVAQALKDVIKRQGLISSIQGKEYPRCEAWTLLGTMLGVFPVLVWTKQVDGGWEARVEAKTKDGAVVGAAEAQCLKTERNWAQRDDFALRSMAQTRATAKCLRMPLGFVMTLAGYEPTPAEEMVSESQATKPQRPPLAAQPAPKKASVATDATRAWMIDRLKACHSEATEYFEKCGQLLPTESMHDLPLRFVPIDKAQMELLTRAIGAFAAGDEAQPAFPPNGEPTIEVPRELPLAGTGEEWRLFPMPWGNNAGMALEDLDKKYLFGLWANYVVETEYNGKPKKPETIAKDTKFREMLDQAGIELGFKKKD